MRDITRSPFDRPRSVSRTAKSRRLENLYVKARDERSAKKRARQKTAAGFGESLRVALPQVPADRCRGPGGSLSPAQPSVNIFSRHNLRQIASGVALSGGREEQERIVSLRETINKNPKQTTAITAGIIGLAFLIIIWQAC